MTGRADDRIAKVDALRGFALLGILVVNSKAFASAYYGTSLVDPAFTSPLDQGLRWLVAWLFETKFYLMFSFLFGYSFTLQMQSAERAGEAFLPRILRRQTGLWLIGVAHAVLLFFGDILTTYAVLGLILVLLRERTDDQLLALARTLIVAAALLWALVGVLVALFGDGENRAVVAQAVLATEQAYRGGVLSVVGENQRQLGSVWVALGLIQAPCALAMFCLGLVAGRRELIRHVERYRSLGGHLVLYGCVIGLPAAAIYAYADVFLPGTAWELFGLALGILTAPFLTGAYVALVLFGFGTPTGARVVRLLAPAGRMALSNYLLQSLSAAVVFYGYGFGLIGRFPPAAVLAVALGIFSIQLVFSAWWLRHFAYGPVEWLLRALTLGRRPPMRSRQA